MTLSMLPRRTKHIGWISWRVPMANVSTRLDFAQVKGQTIQDFISDAQDRSRNALAKSNQAALRAFLEQLKSDQALFEQESILTLSRYSKLGLKKSPWGFTVLGEGQSSVCLLPLDSVILQLNSKPFIVFSYMTVLILQKSPSIQFQHDVQIQFSANQSRLKLISLRKIFKIMHILSPTNVSPPALILIL